MGGWKLFFGAWKNQIFDPTPGVCCKVQWPWALSVSASCFPLAACGDTKTRWSWKNRRLKQKHSVYFNVYIISIHHIYTKNTCNITLNKVQSVTSWHIMTSCVNPFWMANNGELFQPLKEKTCAPLMIGKGLPGQWVGEAKIIPPATRSPKIWWF